MSYERLAEEVGRPPKAVRDWTAHWDEMTPLASVNGTIRERVESFAARKHISLEGLEALGARIAFHKHKSGAVYLAFAGHNWNGTVTAIKYRPLNGSSHDSIAEQPSVWLRPILAGKLTRSTGSSQKARPTRPDSSAWSATSPRYSASGRRPVVSPRMGGTSIPRGATVHLCHDADTDGDEGAEKAAKIIGGRTVRLRPPDGYGDWCDWEGRPRRVPRTYRRRAGERRHVRVHPSTSSSRTRSRRPSRCSVSPARSSSPAARCSWSMAPTGAGSRHGRSTGSRISPPARLARLSVPRPFASPSSRTKVRRALFQRSSPPRSRAGTGRRSSTTSSSTRGPWGEFTFADADAREALVDVLRGARDRRRRRQPHPRASASAPAAAPTRRSSSWTGSTECGLKSTLAFWLLHHENKAGQISGDWGRHPDTKVSAAGRRQPAAHQARLGRRPAGRPSQPPTDRSRRCSNGSIETQGYNVIELDTVGASDSELEQRVDDFLIRASRFVDDDRRDRSEGHGEPHPEAPRQPRFDYVLGKRGAELWSFQPTPSALGRRRSNGVKIKPAQANGAAPRRHPVETGVSPQADPVGRRPP